MRVSTRLLLPLAALLLAPAATAHSTHYSPDGQYLIVVGQLNEPVITHAKTGLDLCFTTNTTARQPVTFNVGGITATLVAPDGQTWSQDLRAQFGRPGCYQFKDAYVLTRPGQYTVNLAGSLNGTQVHLIGMNAGGAVSDETGLTFPDAGIASRQALAAQNAALTQRVDDLSARLASLEGANAAKVAPGLALSAVPLALGLAAAIARRP